VYAFDDCNRTVFCARQFIWPTGVSGPGRRKDAVSRPAKRDFKEYRV